jgi:hypothetical protein
MIEKTNKDRMDRFAVYLFKRWSICKSVERVVFFSSCLKNMWQAAAKHPVRKTVRRMACFGGLWECRLI